MPGLLMHSSPDATALVAELGLLLRGTRPDPFVMEAVVTPHAHVRRWLTNELAHRLGRPGEGICAGVSFLSPGRLLRELSDGGGFWHPRQLAWRLLHVINAYPDEPQLAQLRRHLQASRTAYPVVHRIATLFHRYLHWRPELVARWEAGEDCDEHGDGLGFDSWQPTLWRLAAAAASPLAATEDFLDRLRRAPRDLPLPATVSIVHPDPMSPRWINVVEALSMHRDIHVFMPRVTGYARALSSPTGPAARLSRFEDEAQAALVERAQLILTAGRTGQASTLGWLQGRLRGETVAPPAPDATVQVHGGHGLERQVEILRDVVTAVLAGDPSLEPRDIVIACPSLTPAAPLIQAAFRLPVGVPGRHPAHDFRVQLADRSSADANPLTGVLVQALTLVESRATAADVLAFCAQPSVSDRFGLDADTIARLTQLATEAGVRWGLSAPHRGRFGLAQVPQNTWAAGLQRMLLGVALSEELLPVVGTVLPLDGVEDGDLMPLGGLSELISRLSRLATEYETPATLSGWVTRLQEALDALTLVGGDNAWQRTDALLRIADLAERGAGDEQLGLTELTSLLSDEFERAEARSGYGNGSLTVCSLRSLRAVPYRVICLFGLDDGVFPRAPERDGDNLMLRAPRAGEPDPAAEDRLALVSAINATRDAFVLVHQSRSGQTNEPIPPPAPLADLLQLLDEGGVEEIHHPLQPFSPSLFGAQGAAPRSYDPAGLRGARALSAPRRPPAVDNTVPPAPELTEVALDDLIRFVRDPARHFLRERCGLTYWDDARPPVDIPIELDGLERWEVGDRLLSLVRAGHSIEAAVRAEWLRGAVPPGAIGTRLLKGLEAQLTPIIRDLPDTSGGVAVHHDIAFDCGPVRVTGRIATEPSDLVLEATFAKVSLRRTVGLWLRLVALAATEDRSWQGLLVGRGGRLALRGPDPATAREVLARWIRLYRIGLDAPLPLPLEFGARLADLLRCGRDPLGAERELRSAYDSRGPHWMRFYPRAEDLLVVPTAADDLDQPDERWLACAAARVVWDPITAHQAVPVS